LIDSIEGKLKESQDNNKTLDKKYQTAKLDIKASQEYNAKLSEENAALRQVK